MEAVGAHRGCSTALFRELVPISDQDLMAALSVMLANLYQFILVGTFGFT